MSSKDFRQKWLSIVGIGEDGLDGLNPVGRSLVKQAQVLIGGNRQLAMVPEAPKEENPKKCEEASIIEFIEEINQTE